MTKAKFKLKTKADIDKYLKGLADEGSLIALTPKQANTVAKFVKVAKELSYEQGKKESLLLRQSAEKALAKRILEMIAKTMREADDLRKTEIWNWLDRLYDEIKEELSK